MPPGDLALGQVAVVAAVVDPHPLLGEVQLDDPGDRAGQELPVVADDDRRRAEPGDEPLEALQPVQVEVVRGLVEQQHVVARQEQRGQPRTGGLPAGQRRHRHVQRDAEPDVVRDGARTFLEVRAAEGEPAVQREGVRVVGARGAGAERLRGRVHLVLRTGDPGPAGEERRDRLPGPPVGLLRQVPDRGRRRAEDDGALLRRRLPGEHAQERRLAGAVRAHEADDVAGGEHEVETGEQHAGAVAGGEVGGLQGGAHLVGTVPGVAAALGG